ncbi:MAG: hypothetical protein DWQ29_15735 [Planctomycetota bacterium]|nr:MAG: hypothetical protein DWQ29_15735 [Planctomycetota bacterium]
MESAMLRRAVAPLLIAALLAQCGCQFWSRFKGIGHSPAPCTFDAGATSQEVVAHVNRNVAPPDATPPLTAWRSTGVKMKVGGFPSVNGTIAVEAPHRLRIQAAMPGTQADVADIGANDEEMWFWNSQDKRVIAVKHEDLPYAMSQMQLPLEPEWLMEVLGVAPLDPGEFELVRPVTDAGHIDLVAERTMPTGQVVRRIVRVDACHGRIMEHRLETSEGDLIAIARLSDYRSDPSGQYTLPHTVDLYWPASRMNLTMRITGSITANPPAASDALWTMPNRPDSPRFRLGRPPGTPVRRSSMEQPVLRSGMEQPVLQQNAVPFDYGGSSARPFPAN